jgi:hypothetical protein
LLGGAVAVVRFTFMPLPSSTSHSLHSSTPSIICNRPLLKTPISLLSPTFSLRFLLPSAAQTNPRRRRPCPRPVAGPHVRSELPSPGVCPSDLLRPRSPWRRRPAAGTGKPGRCCSATSPSRRCRGSTTTSARPAPPQTRWSRLSSSGRQ